MQSARFVCAGCIILLVLAAVAGAGCTTRSPGAPAAGTADSLKNLPKADDCFFRVNDSAHGETTGSSQEITLTGYISNICRQPMENMAVRGTFYDNKGKAFATADTFVGHVGYHQMVPFRISVNTRYTDLYTYDLAPVFR